MRTLVIAVFHVLALVALGVIAARLAHQDVPADPVPLVLAAAAIVASVVTVDLVLVARAWLRWTRRPAPPPTSLDRALFDLTTDRGLRLRTGGAVLLGGRRALVTDQAAPTPGGGPVVVDADGRRWVLDGRRQGLVPEHDAVRGGRVSASVRVATLVALCCLGPLGWIAAYLLWASHADGRAARRAETRSESRERWAQRRMTDAELDHHFLQLRGILDRWRGDPTNDRATEAALEVLTHDRAVLEVLVERARTAVELRQSAGTPAELADELVRQALLTRNDLTDSSGATIGARR